MDFTCLCVTRGLSDRVAVRADEQGFAQTVPLFLVRVLTSRAYIVLAHPTTALDCARRETNTSILTSSKLYLLS